MLNVYVVSLGCPKNRVDTETLLASLGPVTLVASPEEADLALVNTCAFIQPAVEESLAEIMDIADRLGRVARPATRSRRALRARRRPPARNTVLAVVGCLIGRYGHAELAREMPEVDLWQGLADFEGWPARIAQTLAGRGLLPSAARIEDWRPERRALSTGPGHAYLKIVEGCDHHCSFCTIPSIRGRTRSRDAASLVDEARRLLDAGVKELVLVGQDLTSYGHDQGDRTGESLRRLLDKLLPLEGLAWLRLLYLYPAGLDDALLDYLAAAGMPFLPYFDIPLQHADPVVLRRMGRPFRQEPMAAIERVRARFPAAALRTSLIVGFPGEGPAEFERLLRFVERARLQHLGAFAYCPEEGTRAADLEGRVEDAEKQRRRAAVMELQSQISAELLAELVHETMDVLVERPDPQWPGLFQGRVWLQAPEQDGLTYVSGPPEAPLVPGDMVQAEIVDARTYDLSALA